MKYHFLIVLLLLNYSFQKILPTCNPLNDNDEGKLYQRDVRGKLGPRVVGQITGSITDISWEPFSIQSSSSIDIVSIYDRDPLYGPSVISHQYEGLHSRITSKFSEKDFYFFGYCSKVNIWGSISTDCQVENLYKENYPEEVSLLSYNTHYPIYVTSDYSSKLLAWVAPLKNTSVYDIYIFNMTERFRVPFFDEGNSVISYGRPQICDERIFYERFDTSSNTSSIFMYNVENEYNELISPKNKIFNNFYPQIASHIIDSGEDTFQWTCTLGYLSTKSSVKLNPQTGSANMESTSVSDNIYISLLRFPLRSYGFITKELYNDGDFNTLIDFALSSNYIFIILKNPNNNKYIIRYSEILHINFITLNDTLSDTPLKFQETHNGPDAMVYHQKYDNNYATTYVIKLSGDESKPYFEMICNLTFSSNKYLSYTTLDDTLLVYVPSSVENHNDFCMFDMNKDNDLLFDANDMFPVETDEIWDSDNDGIGDNSDLINFKNSGCVKNGCINDTLILYIVYAGVVIIMFGYLVAIKYIYYKLTIKSIAIADEENIDNGDQGGGGGGGNAPPAPPPPPKGMDNKGGKGGGGGDGKGTGNGENEKIHKCAEKYDVIMVVLSILSILLCVYEYFEFHGLNIRDRKIIQWIDLYISTLFLVNLCNKCYSRDIKEHPHLWKFLLLNWYEILSLLTEFPGTSGIIPIPAWVYSIFRVYRLYRRFIQNQYILSLMVKNPAIFVGSLMLLFILICSIYIKILEQNETSDFSNLFTVLWFCFVTVSTVGYGDLAPTNLLARIITILLLLVGIGLFSTISALTIAKIVNLGNTEPKKRALKQELKERWDSLIRGLVFLSTSYNPLAVIFKDKLKGDKEAKVDQITNAAKSLSSESMNVTKGLERSFELPVDQIMKGASGKFRVHNMSSQTEIIRDMMKKDEAEILAKIVNENADYYGNVQMMDFSTKCEFILRKFHLDQEGRLGIGNFKEMKDELCDILFEPYRKNELCVEKIFAIKKKVAGDLSLSYQPDYRSYNLHDPINRRINLIEEFFERYGITSRPDFCDLLSQFESLLILFERVQTAKWLIENCLPGPYTVSPDPVLESVVQPYCKLPSTKLAIIDEEFKVVPPTAKDNTFGLMPPKDAYKLVDELGKDNEIDTP